MSHTNRQILTCKHCNRTVFIELRMGQFHDNPLWLDRGLPLPRHIVDEWSYGGGIVYQCAECGQLANKPRTSSCGRQGRD